MLSKIFVAASLSLAASGLVAQSCSTLTVTGNGAPGTSVVFDLAGSTPLSLTALAVGDTAGTTVFDLGPLGSLTLGLASPFIPLPFGFTDTNGAASRTINVPPGNIPGIDLFGQAVSMSLLPATPGPNGPGRPAVTFCTSNVVSFHLGN